MTKMDLTIGSNNHTLRHLFQRTENSFSHEAYIRIFIAVLLVIVHN